MTSVLLVDDEPDFLVVMEKLLKRQGYEVSETITGKGALKKVREERPDVVLLDVMMPDIEGWDVCRMLKKDPKTRDLPIIMLTVMAEDDSIKRSFEYAEADWHVSKPFDIDLFFFILEAATGRQGSKEIEKLIEKAIERDKRMKKVFDMINPNLLEHRYEFLNK